MRDQQAEDGSPNAQVGPLQCEEKKEKMNEGKRTKTGRPTPHQEAAEKCTRRVPKGEERERARKHI